MVFVSFVQFGCNPCLFETVLGLEFCLILSNDTKNFMKHKKTTRS